jgi:hypothetical protein
VKAGFHLVAWILLFLATRTGADNGMTKLKIPFKAKEVGHCYDRLKQTLPVYQDGIAEIRNEMESNHPFEQRLQNVLTLHASNLQAAQTRESAHTWNEEDIYLCCLYDMLEAMYANEAEQIAGGSGTLDEKRKNLSHLAESITRLPFGSPQYRTAIRPRLENAIAQVSRQLE